MMMMIADAEVSKYNALRFQGSAVSENSLCHLAVTSVYMGRNTRAYIHEGSLHCYCLFYGV